jgi:hypothetical protein
MPEATAPARRWRVEAVLAVLAAALGVLTVAVPAWIEVLTGLDPDAGSGALDFRAIPPGRRRRDVSGGAAGLCPGTSAARPGR